MNTPLQRVRDAVARTGIFARPTLQHPDHVEVVHGAMGTEDHYDKPSAWPAFMTPWLESHIRPVRTTHNR